MLFTIPLIFFLFFFFFLMVAHGRIFSLPFFQNETEWGDYTLAIMTCQCYSYGERLFQTQQEKEGGIAGLL